MAPGRPPELWRIDVGQGFAGPVVVDDHLVLFHRLGASEVIDALDRTTGARLWRHEYPTTYRDDFGFDAGPRSVPVVVDGVVYTFGAQGVLSAVRLEAGELLWRVDTAERFRVRKGFFGAAGSPLVERGRVLLNPGGEEGGSPRSARRPASSSGARPRTRPATLRPPPPPSLAGLSRSSSPAPASSPWTPRRARSCTASTGGRARGPR